MPAPETDRGSKARVPRWLRPGRRRAAGRAGRRGACVPADVRARARCSLTLPPRSLTMPLCTVRIEHPAARPGRRAFSTSPACWLVLLTCRIEDISFAYIYVPPGILAHGSLDFISDRAQHSYHSDRKPDRRFERTIAASQRADAPTQISQLCGSRSPAPPPRWPGSAGDEAKPGQFS